jgi:hypothetical protein
MGFISVMKAIGHGLGIGLKVADTVEQNPAVQAMESIFLPAKVVTLIAGALHATAGAQAISEGSNATAGLTGEQKMSIALAAFNKVYVDYAQSAGLPVEPDKVKAVLQLAFNLLDGVPSGIPQAPVPTGTPVLPTTSPSA